MEETLAASGEPKADDSEFNQARSVVANIRDEE